MPRQCGGIPPAHVITTRRQPHGPHLSRGAARQRSEQRHRLQRLEALRRAAKARRTLRATYHAMAL